MTLPIKGTHVSWKIQIYWNKHLWETRTPLHYITQFYWEQKITSPWNKKHLPLNLLEIMESHLSQCPSRGAIIAIAARTRHAPAVEPARGAFRGLVTGRPQNEEPGIHSIDILRVFLIYIVSAFFVPSKLLWNLPVGFNNYRHFPYKKVWYC